jgi:hypothetical protein
VPDPLELFCPLADAVTPIVSVHNVSAWPGGVFARLLDLGLLIPGEEANRVLCPDCHEHYEEVLACEGPGRTTYYFITCPQGLRVRVSRDARRQWAVNFSALVRSLTATLKLTGKVSELSPNRMWRLGRTNWQGTSRDVLLARGLNWADATSIRGSITQARKPIVFVPHFKPAADFWNGRVPPVIALDQVATIGETGLDIDPLEITTAVQEADTAPRDVVAVTSEQLTLMIRRQMKAEHKSNLTDDVFLAAYRQHGSVRKAAEFLSQETCSTISKDQVQRAVTRAGGAGEVLNAEDSDSVVRPVASRSRDRKGKNLIRAKPKEE